MLYYKTYILDKDKDWVIFIHGAGGSSTIWYRQIKAYREKFNVLFMDLRGHGHSRHAIQEHYKEKYTFKMISLDVLDVLNHLDIDKAHFVGVSLGTIIIRTIEELDPARVRSSVLCGAIMRLNVRSRFLVWSGHKLKRLIPFIWLYKLFAWVILPRANHEESRNLFIREAAKMAKKEFLRWFRLTYEVNPLLRYFRESESGNPTLYIMGREDHMFLPPVKKMVESHQKSILTIIDDCGHVCNIEKPDEFNEISIRFLLEQSRKEEELEKAG
ncbi:MAG: alpha/beta hydrolase [Balneolaceae bacterium]